MGCFAVPFATSVPNTINSRVVESAFTTTPGDSVSVTPSETVTSSVNT